LILLLLVLRIVNSLISLFPVFTLFHTKAACVALIGIIFPATAILDTVLIGEFLSYGPDLYIEIIAYHYNNDYCICHIIIILMYINS